MNTNIYAEKKQLLSRVLKRHNVAPGRYSLDGYKEEAVCLEPSGRGWDVYDGERGRHLNPEHCAGFEVAGYRLISRLSDSEEMEKAILSNYIISIIREYQSVKTRHAGQKTPDLDTTVLPVMRTGVKRKKTNFKKKKSISAKTGVSHNKTIAGRKRAKPALSSRHRRITT